MKMLILFMLVQQNNENRILIIPKGNVYNISEREIICMILISKFTDEQTREKKL